MPALTLEQANGIIAGAFAKAAELKLKPLAKAPALSSLPSIPSVSAARRWFCFRAALIPQLQLI